MDNYRSNSQTKEIQQYGLQILTVFHEICEANQLHYVLDFGTLLGAVRHEGFIPWDDDIDVAMPRQDFEKFKQIAEKGLPKNIFLQTHESDPNYYNTIAKLRIPKKQYTEKAMQYFEIVHGPWLDIFIYDYKHDDKEHEQEKQTLYNRRRHFYPALITTLLPNHSTNSTLLSKSLRKLLLVILKISQNHKKRGLFMRYLDAKYEKLTTLIKNAPNQNSSGDMITYTFPIHSESDEKGLRLNINDFKNKKLQKFENRYFYIPVNYDRILTDRYGDYNKLPPYEKRKSNHQWV